MKKTNARLFQFVIGLFVLISFVAPQLIWAQAPQHLQGLKVSPLEKGEFLLFSKKSEEALKVFEDFWKQEPENSYAVRGVVRSYRALNKIPDVISKLKTHLEKQPGSSAASYGLGYAYYLQGKFKESRKVLNEALKFDPKNVLALNNLSATLAEEQDYKGALDKVREAIGIAPNELMLYRNLQMIYASSGQADKFEKEYRALLTEKVSAKARGYGLVLAQQLRQKSFKLYAGGQVDDCIRTIDEMLVVYREVDHKPGIVAGLFSLAVLYEEQGKTELALEKYREVLKINPQHIQASEKSKLLGQKKE